MKKTKIACTLIVLFSVAICIIMLCAVAGQPNPQYIWNGNATIHQLDLSNLDDIGRDTETPLDSSTKNYALQVFEELSQMYGIEKSAPSIAYFHPHDHIDSQYYDGCIYINFMDYDTIEDSKSAIAHELIHYLTDNNGVFAFQYILGDTYLFGSAFNEGVTNYFSNKYALNDEAYLYETHVASLIAICYGEKALKNDFFSSDITKLRVDFNNSLKKIYANQQFDNVTVTPFDLMTSMLNTFGETSDNQVRINQMLAIEEMLLFYAKEKGCEDEVRTEVSNFVATHNLSYLLPLV